MANNFYEIFDNQISKMQEQLRDDDSETAMPVRMQILKTMETFRAQEQGTKILDMIKEQLDFLKKDFEKTSDIAFSDNKDGVQLFVMRETTKQKMLNLIEKLINATMTPQQEAAYLGQPVTNEFCDKLQKEQPNNPEKNEKLSNEFSDKLNGEIASALNKTE